VQIILDNINAVLIGGVIMLIIASMSLNNRETMIDGARYQAGRMHASDLTRVIERDLRNLGVGADTSEASIAAFQWDDDAKAFEFRTTSDTVMTTTSYMVKYELVKSRKMATKEDSVQCYQLKRYALSGGVYKPDGNSIETITELDIALLDRDGAPVNGDLAAARSIDVSLVAISPLGEDEIVERYRWRTRFHPINLSIEYPR
jgi:hypothetical protein